MNTDEAIKILRSLLDRYGYDVPIRVDDYGTMEPWIMGKEADGKVLLNELEYCQEDGIPYARIWYIDEWYYIERIFYKDGMIHISEND